MLTGLKIIRANQKQDIQTTLHQDKIMEKAEIDEIIPKQSKKQQKQLKNQQKKESRIESKKVHILASCHLCLQNQNLGENYILSNSNYTMLILPNYSIFFIQFYNQECFQSYWHFYIVPLDHVQSLQELEEEEWEEVRNYMKCLTSLLDALNMQAVFYENAFNFSNMPHCKLECVGVPYHLLGDANLELYFQQAMQDLDGFWSTHQKIIKLEKGGIRKQVPKGFPYFYVDFSTQFGYAHVIENEKYFSVNFAREILANVLKLDKNLVLYPKEFVNEDAEKTSQKFKKIWEKFDWTSQLKE